jgi:hypothetical protein
MMQDARASPFDTAFEFGELKSKHFFGIKAAFLGHNVSLKE